MTLRRLCSSSKRLGLTCPGAARRRRAEVALVVAWALVLGAVPASATAAAQDATCRVELTAVHHKLRGFGVARVGGTADAAAAVTCADLEQQPYVASARVTIDVVTPDGTMLPSAADRSCSSSSLQGVAVLTCSASFRYDDPALTEATFRGCVDLVTPVDLPPDCVEAATSP